VGEVVACRQRHGGGQRRGTRAGIGPRGVRSIPPDEFLDRQFPDQLVEFPAAAFATICECAVVGLAPASLGEPTA
jgi:hypothetical protein